MKKFTLGIDTGGTYTDAVFLQKDPFKILGWAKTLTSYEDFSIGISEALEKLAIKIPFSFDEIEFVALSTTLATNAAAEDKIQPHSLVLIGYDKHSRESAELQKKLSFARITHVAGGHDHKGNEREPLDADFLQKEIVAITAGASSVGISSLFGARNPTHELKAKKLIEELTSLPVSCGHELSSLLDAYVRATTVSINAGLIPILRTLLLAVDSTLKKFGISAPLMIVRGDGTLVDIGWAISRPIETLLSGPMASAKGGYYLAGKIKNTPTDLCCVIDMGGTTSDIVVLKKGNARVSLHNTQIGRHRTHIRAIDTTTLPLGGDISVTVLSKEVRLGTTRVLPLGRAAEKYPSVADLFHNATFRGNTWAESPLFIIPTEKLKPYDLGKYASHLLTRHSPLLLSDLLLECSNRAGTIRFLGELENRGEIIQSGFTPTDALHAAGKRTLYNPEICVAVAKRMGAAAEMSRGQFCNDIFKKINERLRKELLIKIIQSEFEGETVERDDFLLEMIARQRPATNMAIRASLSHTVIGIGAPAKAYIPNALKTIAHKMIIPEFAMIAGAVGAASSGLHLSYDLMIIPLKDGFYRSLFPFGPQDYSSLEEAVSVSKLLMLSWMKSIATAAGALKSKTTITHQSTFAPTSGGQEIFLHSTLHCEASQK